MNREVTGNKLAGFVDVGWRLFAVVALLALGFWLLNPVPRASAASFNVAGDGGTEI